MHNRTLAVGALAIGIAWPAVAASDSASAEKIPDLSGGWARTGNLVETFEAIPGNAGAGPMLSIRNIRTSKAALAIR